MKYLRCVALLILAGLGASFLPAQTAAPGSSTTVVSSTSTLSSVPASRVARLRHGINASEWFAQVYDQRGYTKEHFQNWTTAQDIALMQAMGFDYVRLSVDPQPMMPSHRPDEIPAEYLGYLDAAVKISNHAFQAKNFFAIEAQNHAQHAVRGRMLRAHVDDELIGIQERLLMGFEIEMRERTVPVGH